MVHQVTTVRVMHGDGEVMEFDQPVIAKQLMKAFPGHLVVHCTQVSRDNTELGMGSKVSMLRADDILQLGQTYCLLRVPTQRQKGSQPKAPGSKASNRVIGPYGTQEQQEQIGVHYRLPPVAALQQQHHDGPWRPHLDSIVESPLNAHTPSRAHSLTMSPLARQAGYVPGSAMNFPARIAPSPTREEAPSNTGLLLASSSAHSWDHPAS